MDQRQAPEGDTRDTDCVRDGDAPETVVAADAARDTAGADPDGGGAGQESSEPAPRGEGDGPVRRALIRATLQLPDGAPPPPREPPVFTMHEQPGQGDGRDSQPARKPGRRRGGPPRTFNGQPGGHSGNGRVAGNHARPDGRTAPKSRSSRRGRGRAR